MAREPGEAGPERGRAMAAADVAVFEALRPLLTGLAYRMLGEVQEAEDAVQDAYLRWDGADRAAVEEPRAWLTKVVTNLCLTRLTSARARRESYAGAWLPEPVPGGPPAPGAPFGTLGALGPLETVQQRDSVSLALLSLMEALTPAERAVFVLREAFAYPHREIAGILEVTEAASRQLHHRARLRVAAAERRFAPDGAEWRRLVERFLDAAARGDMAALEELLAADVVAWSDGGGKVSAARRPVAGRDRVARFLLGVAGRTAGLAPGTFTAAVEDVNGGPAVVGRLDGTVVVIAALEVSGGLITAVHSVLNPDKLAYASRVLSHPGGPSGPS
ncbi:RNA polymerase sigma-70 factor [Actinomadura fibrosa]|uniref:RNA polymerase sigma-70 factor n=1 Tax=Actinomadura fibrosa TaxID=111802 RepID=A0ABW2XQ68_9ACTN|nr:RNA polymerase sigma-70 factor [Actinomadura fibrosa]